MAQPHFGHDFLTNAHVAALHEVQLQIAFVTHGQMVEYPGFGQYVTARDEDYVAMKGLVDGMDAARGDHLAIEGRAYIESEVQWDDVILSRLMIDRAWNNPLAKAKVDLFTPVDVALEASADARSINPMEYAAGHACLKGVPIFQADASKAQWDARQQERAERSWPGRLKVLIGQDTDKNFRDAHALRRLGDKAIEIVHSRPSQSEKPVLGFGVGKAHTWGIKARLDARGIPFTYVQTGMRRDTAIMSKVTAAAAVGRYMLISPAHQGRQLARRARKLKG